MSRFKANVETKNEVRFLPFHLQSAMINAAVGLSSIEFHYVINIKHRGIAFHLAIRLILIALTVTCSLSKFILCVYCTTQPQTTQSNNIIV